MQIMTRLLGAAVALAAVLSGIAPAAADDYPSRPITILVGFPPGGPTDIVGRVMADYMRKSLGQPLIVENVGGAAGTIAGARAARAAPDGYTLNVGQWTTQVGAPALYPITYDPIKSFEPIAELTSTYLWIVARPTLPAKNTQEFVAWLKTRGGAATAASVGVGSSAHVCLVDFANKSGTKFQQVPYRGGAPAMQDLISGHVDFGCLEASQTLPHYRSGKLKVFGVAANKRWFGAPDVPTLAEGGVPNVELTFWHGLWAPKGTPKPIIDKLNQAVRTAFQDPALQKRFASLGHEIPTPDRLSPEALLAHHTAEIEKWWPIMKAAGIKLRKK